jgi:MSHA biogenesis protein MshN
MSLINQMLKDLDARHESDVRGRLHREVRALPSGTENRGLRLTIVILLVLAVAAAAGWAGLRYLAGSPSGLGGRVSTVPAPALPEPNAASAPALPAVLSGTAVMPAETASTTAPPVSPSLVPESGQLESVALDAASGLKLSSLLDKVPAVAAERAKPPATVAAPSPARTAQATTAAAAPAAGAAARSVLPTSTAPAAASGPGRVDKTPVAKTQRERAEADYRRAVGLVNNARIQEATDLLLDTLRQDGGHVASRQLLVRLLAEQQRKDEAMALLAEGLISQPGQITWAMMLARLQVDRGDLAAAARTLQGSQSFAAGNADYQGFSGHVQQRLGQPKEAINFYLAATRIAPADGRWWLGLGLALEADHRTADAREAFLRARASGSLNADLLAIVDQKLR